MRHPRPGRKLPAAGSIAGVALCALVLAAPTRSSALDHFVTYVVKDASGSICSAESPQQVGATCTVEADCGGTQGVSRLCVAKGFAKGLRVSLADRFESATFNVLRPVDLGTPASLSGAPILDPLTQLEAYQIALTKTAPRQPAHAPQTGLLVQDAFHPAGGELVLDTKKPDRLLVPTATSATGPVARPDPAGGPDPHTCYAVKPSRNAPKFVPIRAVSVDAPYSPPARIYDLKKPSRLCVPTAVTAVPGGDVEPIEDPNAALVCYRAVLARTTPRQVKHQPVKGIFLGNRFGPERVDTVREDELCVRALLLPVLGCVPDTTVACYDGPAGTEGVGLCRAGARTCSPDGTFGSCEGQVLPATEIAGDGIDQDCDGTDLPGSGGIPPSTVTIDPTVRVDVTQIEGFDGAAARPVTALTDRSGIPMHFVENELIIVTDDVDAALALASRWGGTVLKSLLPAQVGMAGKAQYLLRVAPSFADDEQLIADLRTLEPWARNDLRVASAAGYRLLAAAAREAAAGLEVALNVVMLPHGFEERTTAENASLPLCPTPTPGPTPSPGPRVPPGADGCVNPGISVPGAGTPDESFDGNAYAWSYMRAGGPQNIGVGEAWRALSLAGLLGNKVGIAVIDGGFTNSAVDNPVDTTYVNAVNPLEPNVYPANTMPCSGGANCPWHGTNVVSAAMGPADDLKGAAGPAGPIGQTLMVRRGNDVFGIGLAYMTAFVGPGRIVNMSFGERLPATLSWAALPLNVITAAAHAGGKLLVASAGNDGADVDSEDCFLGVCWEDAWWAPCENAGVFCVGALDGNDTTRAPFSNWGNGDVDLFGPGTVWVGGDPFDIEPHAVNGTSFAAPFVAGVAGLVMAARPSLDNAAVEQALIQTAWPSADPVRRYVNAQGAVNLAIGGSPICTPPQILSSTLPHTTAPCLPNDFTVTHSPSFGPFTYQWKKLVPGTTTLVDVTDGDNVSGSSTDHMTIDPFRPADAGRYAVEVSNICGSTTSGFTAVTLVDGRLERAPSLLLPRAAFAMSFDHQRSRMVAFGGSTPITSGPFTLFPETSETWERDVDGAWQLITDQGPPRRASAAMAYDEARGVSVLFGGAACGFDATFCPWGSPGGYTAFFDTWEWDGTTWREVPAAGPPVNRFHSMGYDPVRQRVVLFGGANDLNGGVINGTLYEFDGTSWTARPTTPDPVHGLPPGPLANAPFAFDRARNVYVFFFLWETWELDGTGQWHRRAVHGNRTQFNSGLFGQTDFDTMAFDSARGRTLLYSIVPSGPTTVQAALWEWTGSTWVRKPTPPLPLRNRPALEYDAGRRRTVLTSGTFGLSAFDDVFEWRYFDDDPTCSLGPP